MSRLIYVPAFLLLSAVGCFNPADLAGRKDDPAAEQNAAADPGQPAAVDNAAAPADVAPPVPPLEIDKIPWRMVDKKDAFAKNPNLKVLSTAKMGGEAQDYLTAVSQAYRSAKTRIQVLNLQNNLKIQRELNDGKWPTFDEFNNMLKQNSVDLDNTYPWEIFAYDSEAGEILLLEDPDLKRKIRQERGLPVD